MKDYPDTRFVLSMYLLDVHSSRAAAHVLRSNRPLAFEESEELLTFDENQRELAQAERLRVKP